MHAVSSSAILAASIDESEEFIERWVACHFSLSVKLHDVRRELDAHADAADKELDAIVEDLDVVQGVMLELHDYADVEPRMRSLMQGSHVLQHGVIAIYTWLSEILAALPGRAVARRRPSFVDDSEMPAVAMLSTLERLHPDLQRLVRKEEVTADDDIASKLAICFRQIGAAVVRISGRASSRPPKL